MNVSLLSKASAVGFVFFLCGGLFAAGGKISGREPGLQTGSSAKAMTSSGQALKNPGETARAEDGSYERVLLSPPGEAGLTAGLSWEIPMELAIELSQKDAPERWSVIRRNLLLSPDGDKDRILWTDVLDAILDRIRTISPVKEPKLPDFGLRVGFPKKKAADGSETTEAEVVLTFNKDSAKGQDFEGQLSQAIAVRMTGVEGFVSIGSEGALWSAADTSAALKELKLKLYDGAGNEVEGPHMQGSYFLFSSLAADKKFGSDFKLKIFRAATESAEEAGLAAPLAEYYVPVRQGTRTRLDLVLDPDRITGAKGDLAEAPSAAADFYEAAVTASPLLTLLTSHMWPNPGLHIGFVVIKGEGPKVFWSTRFRLLPQLENRRPRFIDRGTLKLQCLTETIDPARPDEPPVHYVKLTWCGRVDEEELALQNRHEPRFLGIRRDFLGLGLGAVSNVEPSLFAVGASLKPVRGCEVFLGAGIRNDYPTSFVYGLTLDLQDMIAIFRLK